MIVFFPSHDCFFLYPIFGFFIFIFYFYFLLLYYFIGVVFCFLYVVSCPSSLFSFPFSFFLLPSFCPLAKLLSPSQYTVLIQDIDLYFFFFFSTDFYYLFAYKYQIAESLINKKKKKKIKTINRNFKLIENSFEHKWKIINQSIFSWIKHPNCFSNLLLQHDIM